MVLSQIHSQVAALASECVSWRGGEGEISPMWEDGRCHFIDVSACNSFKHGWIQTQEAPIALHKTRCIRSAQPQAAAQKHGHGGPSIRITI